MVFDLWPKTALYRLTKVEFGERGFLSAISSEVYTWVIINCEEEINILFK